MGAIDRECAGKSTRDLCVRVSQCPTSTRDLCGSRKDRSVSQPQREFPTDSRRRRLLRRGARGSREAHDEQQADHVEGLHDALLQLVRDQAQRPRLCANFNGFLQPWFNETRERRFQQNARARVARARPLSLSLSLFRLREKTHEFL